MLGRPFVLLLEPGKYTGLTFMTSASVYFDNRVGNYLAEESGLEVVPICTILDGPFQVFYVLLDSRKPNLSLRSRTCRWGKIRLTITYVRLVVLVLRSC